MVLEQKIQKIVMVTNCVEEGKTKCIKYWPDDQKLFGSVSVSTVSEEVFADYTVRTIQIGHVNENTQQTVDQYHFTSWPDHGTPDNITSLIHFWQRVRKGEDLRNKTWVIHCSAGVGRTGTFIGLDYLYDEGKDNNHVNVYRCVDNMRDQRVNMVQTKEQYKFLHELVCEALCTTRQPISYVDFEAEYRRLKEVDSATNRTHLRLEYERMGSWIFHKYSETSKNDSGDCENEVSSRRNVENMTKNRDQNIIPAEEFMPFLTTKVSGCTEYINAVYMPMYKSSNGFIVTQNPLEATAVDFYRLLYGREPKLIVSFDDEVETEAIAPPQGSTLTFGPFTVYVAAETEMPSYRERTIEFTYGKSKSSNKVTEYIFTNWNDCEQVPANCEAFLDLLAEIQRIHVRDVLRPVIVKCLNGATKSGLFCVLWNVLERLRIEEEVAIPQTIRNLRHRRRQIIPQFEQFSFLHDAILTHLQKNDIYANA